MKITLQDVRSVVNLGMPDFVKELSDIIDMKEKSFKVSFPIQHKKGSCNIDTIIKDILRLKNYEYTDIKIKHVSIIDFYDSKIAIAECYGKKFELYDDLYTIRTKCKLIHDVKTIEEFTKNGITRKKYSVIILNQRVEFYFGKKSEKNNVKLRKIVGKINNTLSLRYFMELFLKMEIFVIIPEKV